MRILLASSYLPYPLFSGGHIRLYNITRELSKSHEITIVCEKRDYQTEGDIKEVEKICKEIITVDRKKQWTLPNIVKTAFSSYPFLMVGHTNSEMRVKLKTLLTQNHYDLIHCETFYVMQNIPTTNIPIVLVEHNIEYLVYTRFAKTQPNYLRSLLMVDIKKIQYWEENYWKKANKLIAVSEDEKKIMKRKDVEIVPNGVDLAKFNPPTGGSKFKINKNEKKILFIGDFRWVQNRDAVEWILSAIWPEIVSRSKYQGVSINLKLWIVGKHIPNSFKQLTRDESVIFDENAPEETEKVYQQADILLAPIRVGGGTSYKILESMASGLPVVTTGLGVEGLDVAAGDNILVGENEHEIADHVIQLFENEDLYKKIAKNAREKIEKKYDWRIIVKQLEAVYKSATR